MMRSIVLVRLMYPVITVVMIAPRIELLPAEDGWYSKDRENEDDGIALSWWW